MNRHSWDHNNAKRIPACESPDGNGRTERTCLNEGCGLVKITVHGGDGRCCWREWRTKDGFVWKGESTPPCLGETAAARPRVAAQSTAEVIAV